ncbi:MAG: hypothetical protein JWL90_1852 [Chthoniobacteraceae bacterium]|nr:hypothetical protein [Chthoniobacteraceae bacterium]
MKASEFKSHLETHPDFALRFILPDGDVVPAHAHITEAGRIDKSFIDCGGTVRQSSTCTIQAWVAEDIDHRLTPIKLAGILTMAAPLFRCEDLEVEVEYEDCAISQFPVLAASAEDQVLTFQLGSKHTDCLAKELCLPPSSGVKPNGCC